MKFTTIASLLLPASSVLANPLSIRQATTAQFVTTPDGFRTDGNNCGGARVTYDTSGQVATVSLPNNRVGFANGQAQPSRCNVLLDVRYPPGCIIGTATGRSSGNVAIPQAGRLRAQWQRNPYSVSPGDVKVARQDIGRFADRAGPINENYTIDDAINYTVTVANGNNNFRATFATQNSDLQLQPATDAAGSTFTNTQFVFNITNQRACCESFPCFPWR